jgi:hypothetical protein
MFGVGGGAGCPVTIAGGLRTLWDCLKGNCSERVGVRPATRYEFLASPGLWDERHCLRLVLDEEGKPENTREWISPLRHELGVPFASDMTF